MTEHSSSSEVGLTDFGFQEFGNGGSRGGQGGHGGHGGKGGIEGEEGEAWLPGHPGKPGEINSIGVPLASLIAIILASVGGIYWLIKLESKIDSTAKDLVAFQTNVNSLNTPLSQRVFSLEARVNEVARIQSDVRLLISSFDVNGSTRSKLLGRDVEIIRNELSAISTLIQDNNRRIDDIQKDTIENKLKIQNIIEAINPHVDRKR